MIPFQLVPTFAAVGAIQFIDTSSMRLSHRSHGRVVFRHPPRTRRGLNDVAGAPITTQLHFRMDNPSELRESPDALSVINELVAFANITARGLWPTYTPEVMDVFLDVKHIRGSVWPSQSTHTDERIGIRLVVHTRETLVGQPAYMQQFWRNNAKYLVMVKPVGPGEVPIQAPEHAFDARTLKIRDAVLEVDHLVRMSIEGIADPDWQLLAKKVSKLMHQSYGEIFNGDVTVAPPDEPVAFVESAKQWPPPHCYDAGPLPDKLGIHVSLGAPPVRSYTVDAALSDAQGTTPRREWKITVHPIDSAGRTRFMMDRDKSFQDMVSDALTAVNSFLNSPDDDPTYTAFFSSKDVEVKVVAALKDKHRDRFSGMVTVLVDPPEDVPIPSAWGRGAWSGPPEVKDPNFR